MGNDDEATVEIAGNGEYYPETRTIIWDVGELAPKGEDGPCPTVIVLRHL